MFNFSNWQKIQKVEYVFHIKWSETKQETRCKSWFIFTQSLSKLSERNWSEYRFAGRATNEEKAKIQKLR
jgi:hypothetical protein